MGSKRRGTLTRSDSECENKAISFSECKAPAGCPSFNIFDLVVLDLD